MDESLEDSGLFHPVDHSRRSETIGWLVMIGLALVVFELTADSSLAVVLGCMKFGTPDLRVARWLRRADPDHVRGCTCSWFYVVLAILRIGFMAFLIMFVLFSVHRAGAPRGQIERQITSALLVLLACFTGAALTSWMAVGSALLGGVRVWMDGTAKSAVRSGVWPPLIREHWGRAVLGPGLVALYAVFTGCLVLLSLALAAIAAVARGGAAGVFVGLVLATLCASMGFMLAPRVLERVEASTPWDCYPEMLPGQVEAA